MNKKNSMTAEDKLNGNIIAAEGLWEGHTG